MFGTIIGSKVDAERVGQVYEDMAEHLDYICPMIYPSHYSDGNFDIEHPDMEPYKTILAALDRSKQELLENKKEGKKQAVVRPWLQDFTASYLDHYIPYGSKEVRDQVQAVYDAGYDEWILWSASNRYTWEGLLTMEEGKKEQEEIERLRPSTQAAPQETKETMESSKSSEAYRSLEGQVQKEQIQEEKTTSEDSVKKDKKTKKKPNVVIVTTGGSRN